MKKFLILFPESVGDFAMLTPTLHYIKDSFPESKIIMWASRSLAELCSWHPKIDEIHDINTVYNGQYIPQKAWKFWRYLRKEKFDACYFTNDTLFWLPFLAGIPIKLRDQNTLLFRLFCHGAPHRWSADFFRHGAKRAINNIDAVTGHRLPEEYFNFSLNIPESPVLEKYGLTSKSYIFYNADGRTVKKYHHDFYHSILDMLVADGHSVVIAGLRDQFNLQERFGSHSQVHFMTGCPMIEFLNLVRHSKMVVTNDSGPSHIACVFKVKSLVFHPPKDNFPFATTGFYKENYAIKCRPYESHCTRYCTNNLGCPHFDCDRDYNLDTIRSVFRQAVQNESRTWKEKRFETLRQSITILVAADTITPEIKAWVDEMATQGLSITYLNGSTSDIQFPDLLAQLRGYNAQIVHVVAPNTPYKFRVWAMYCKATERWPLTVVGSLNLPKTAEKTLLWYLNSRPEYRYSPDFESLTGPPHSNDLVKHPH